MNKTYKTKVNNYGKKARNKSEIKQNYKIDYYILKRRLNKLQN